MKNKRIRIRVYCTYSKSNKPLFVNRTEMNKKEFDNYVKGWKVKEFEENDSFRTKTDECYSWEDGFINELHD